MCLAATPKAVRPTTCRLRSPATEIEPSLGVSRTADEVQQRRLAGPGRPHQREEVSRGNIEVHALQHVDALAASVETPCEDREP
jgi:hypothetical protein